MHNANIKCPWHANSRGIKMLSYKMQKKIYFQVFATSHCIRFLFRSKNIFNRFWHVLSPLNTGPYSTTHTAIMACRNSRTDGSQDSGQSYDFLAQLITFWVKNFSVLPTFLLSTHPPKYVYISTEILSLTFSFIPPYLQLKNKTMKNSCGPMFSGLFVTTSKNIDIQEEIITAYIS